MTRYGSLAFLALLASSASLEAADAHAQPSASHAAEPEAEYLQLIERAIAQFGVSHFAEARALFRRAHEILPNARTERGIAMTSFELGEYPDAIRHCRAALENPVQPLDDALREHVEGLLERSLAFIGVFRVELTPAEATLLVDDAPPEPEVDGSLLLGLGEHTIRAEHHGHTPVERRVMVRGSEEVTLRLELDASPTGPSPAGGGPYDIAGWTLVGGSALSLAGALVTAFTWLDSREVELTTCTQTVCTNLPTLLAERDGALATTAGLAVLSGLALAAAITTFVLSGESPPHEAAAGCRPGGVGVRCVF